VIRIVEFLGWCPDKTSSASPPSGVPAHE